MFNFMPMQEIRCSYSEVDWLYKKNRCSRFYANNEHRPFMTFGIKSLWSYRLALQSASFPLLKFLLIQDCQEITKEAYINSNFNTHGCLTLINVAGNREVLSVNCLIELLKYSHHKIMVDI